MIDLLHIYDFIMAILSGVLTVIFFNDMRYSEDSKIEYGVRCILSGIICMFFYA